MKVIALLAVLLAGSSGVGGADAPERIPFDCSVRLLVTHPSASERRMVQNGPAGSYLYVGGRYAHSFGLQARIFLPRLSDNRGFWYSNGLFLTDARSHAFVSLGLMRWHRYNFRNQIVLTWQQSSGPSTYAFYGTNLFVGDRPLVLGISSQRGGLALTVDRRTICRTSESAFFGAGSRLFFQIETEVSRYGDQPGGWADEILRKVDGRPYEPYRVHCVESSQGVRWEPADDNRYVATGVFDPTIARTTFGVIVPGSTCKFVPY